MALFTIAYMEKRHHADADRCTIMKDGSVQLSKRDARGRWVTVGAAKAGYWHQVYLVAEEERKGQVQIHAAR